MSASPDRLQLKISPPKKSDAVDCDSYQQQVLDLESGHGPVLVLGAPGTGKTTVAVEYVVERIRSGAAPGQVLMLSGSRQGATRLREQLTARLTHEGFSTRGDTPVRSYASYAFDLIRRMRAEGYLPQIPLPPRLLSGAEQDQVIAELLEGYQELAEENPQQSQGIPHWPSSLQEAVGKKGFRREIRELIDRTSEYGIDPGDLQQLSHQYGRDEWEAASIVLQDYRDKLDLGSAEAFDPAGLLTTACDFLEANPQFAQQERERLPVVVIDDLHDATPAVHRLVKLIATDLDAVITANPDVTVQGFRGANPELLGGYPQQLITSELDRSARDERVLVLRTGHRMRPQVQEGWDRIARRIPAVAGLPALRDNLSFTDDVAQEGTRSTGESVEQPDPGCEVHWVSSPVQQNLLVLQQVLQIHHEQQIPLSEMAVISRTSGTVAELGRYLEQEGVPVQRTMSDTVLNREPAVAALLGIIEAVADTDPSDADEPAPYPLSIEKVTWLMTGHYGGASALHLRKIRQKLLGVERENRGTRTSSELLQALVCDADDEHFCEQLGLNPDSTLPAYARGARQIATMLGAARTAATQTGATAETVLWATWNSVNQYIAQRWEEEALGEDPEASRRAHHDLDAVIALFEAAERYVDQFPGRSAAGFVEYMDVQEVPMDSLSSRTVAEDAISVLTPSAAAGQQWRVVILAGVQDGVWPNTRLRGQLLHTGELVDAVTTGTSPGTVAKTYADRLAEVRRDELRTFSSAVSRASHHVIAIAVSNDDAQPSAFLEHLCPRHDATPRSLTDVPPPLTEQMLVATLRRELEVAANDAEPEGDGPTADSGSGSVAAASALAVLAQHGVSSAHPDQWWGLLPLSTELPVQGPDSSGESDGVIYLSPSKVQSALEAPLNWFVYESGATTGSTMATSLGTFIHSIAEEHPEADSGTLLAELDRRFGELGLEPGWQADALKRRCETMLKFFAEYTIKARQLGRSLGGIEIPVSQDLDLGDLTVKINGRIDRLEVTEDGRPVVVDLKTGKYKPSKAELTKLPQLAAYQTAVKAGALTGKDGGSLVDSSALTHPEQPDGAILVQLGSTNKTVPIQDQPAIPDEPDSWAEEQVSQAAENTMGPQYLAVHDSRGGNCALGLICPMCNEGKQVTEWIR